MTDSPNKYVEFISRQLVKEGKIDLVERKEADYGIHHVATDGNHLTYAVSKGGNGAHATHDTSTGKIHQFLLPKRVSVKSVHEIMNKAIPGGVSKDHAKDVHKHATTE